MQSQIVQPTTMIHPIQSRKTMEVVPLSHLETSSNLQDVTESLVVMRKQECTVYGRRELFPLNTQLSDCHIDASWRQRMVEWMYSVVDSCRLSRDSVAFAACYLDLSLDSGILDTRREFQLAAIAALNLAVKVYDSRTFKLDILVRLSNGLFVAKDVVEMENKMLLAMKWRVHPPTTICFLRQYLRLLPQTLPSVAKHFIVEITQFLSEISVCISDFMKYDPSIIGLASMYVAIEYIDDGSSLPTLWHCRKIADELMIILCGSSNSEPSQDFLEAYEDLRLRLRGNVDVQKFRDSVICFPRKDTCVYEQ